jgi:hypothetical protein
MRVPSSALKIIEVQASALPAPKPASAPAIVSAISVLFIVLHFPQTVLPEDRARAFALRTDRFGADRGAGRSAAKHLYARFVKKIERTLKVRSAALGERAVHSLRGDRSAAISPPSARAAVCPARNPASQPHNSAVRPPAPSGPLGRARRRPAGPAPCRR